MKVIPINFLPDNPPDPATEIPRLRAALKSVSLNGNWYEAMKIKQELREALVEK
jgi:hypothetical protein